MTRVFRSSRGISRGCLKIIGCCEPCKRDSYLFNTVNIIFIKKIHIFSKFLCLLFNLALINIPATCISWFFSKRGAGGVEGYPCG